MVFEYSLHFESQVATRVQEILYVKIEKINHIINLIERKFYSLSIADAMFAKK